MNVSIIIPAYNAAKTIAETLEAVCAQSSPNWEAIIVDDGSSDETVAIAKSFAHRDARFRITHQPHQGLSAARNKGISIARFDWLLFLDADDWILPPYLERLTGVLQADAELDAVYCRYASVTSDGKQREEKPLFPSKDLFVEFGRTCVFPPHACIIRRSLAEVIGCFDVSYRNCQDWDFWQRAVRKGARFGVVDEALAHYRLRPNAASVNSMQLLTDGLRVLTQARFPDPRVPDPHPHYAAGLPLDQLPTVRLYFACWCAGLTIGRGQDTQFILEMLTGDHDPALDPYYVAYNIFEAVPRARGLLPNAWVELWPETEHQIGAFLLAFEQQAQAAGLARRTHTILERLILEKTVPSYPLIIGASQAVRIEVTQPIPDLQLADSIERLQCAVEYGGEPLGLIELPVCDGSVPAVLLSDAIAAKFAWPILGRFFERTLYPQLRLAPGPDTLSIWRGPVHLGNRPIDNEDQFWAQLHDQLGWTLFLQEIWGRPEWPAHMFYDEEAVIDESGSRQLDKSRVVIEISEELPAINCPGQMLEVVPAVGGAALGVIAVLVKRNTVRPQELRAALTLASGFELCRLAVREALVGQSMAEPGALRARLATRARIKQKEIELLPEEIKALIQKTGAGVEALAGPPPKGSTPAAPDASIGSKTVGGLSPDITSLFPITPGAISALKQIASSGKSSIILSRRNRQEIGTSASYRAALPAAAAKAVVDAASVANEPVIFYPDFTDRPEQILYLPDLIVNPLQARPAQVDNKQKINLARPLPDETARQAAHQSSFTHQLPILMYHRIAPTGSPALARYQVTPATFEAQLDYLKRASFYSISLEEWKLAMATKRPLSGRAVLLTVDDGYLDFAEYAWPLLKKYGFSATVFLVADEIGRSNRWDHIWGEAQPLLTWKEIHQLQNEGAEFGSHSASHPHLTGLSPKQIVDEAARSRAILERELETPIRAFAYPYGDVDPTVQHLVGACGYTLGLSCRPEPSRFHDSLLALPRIEITGSDDLSTFIAKLEPTS